MMRKTQMTLLGAMLAAGCFAGSAAAFQMSQDPEIVLQQAYEKYKDLKEGANADYIPALAEVDPNLFGITVVTVDGNVYTAGDVSSEVSIQSISKVFTMARVMEDSGVEAITDN